MKNRIKKGDCDMKYRKAIFLDSGDQIKVIKTGEIKTVQWLTEAVGKSGKRYVDVLCTDNTAYYNHEVEKA